MNPFPRGLLCNCEARFPSLRACLDVDIGVSSFSWVSKREVNRIRRFGFNGSPCLWMKLKRRRAAGIASLNILTANPQPCLANPQLARVLLSLINLQLKPDFGELFSKILGVWLVPHAQLHVLLCGILSPRNALLFVSNKPIGVGMYSKCGQRGMSRWNRTWVETGAI